MCVIPILGSFFTLIAKINKYKYIDYFDLVDLLHQDVLGNGAESAIAPALPQLGVSPLRLQVNLVLGVLRRHFFGGCLCLLHLRLMGFRLWTLFVFDKDALWVDGSALPKVGGSGHRIPGIGVLLKEATAYDAEGHAGHGIQLGAELHFADEAATAGLGVQAQKGEHEVGDPGGGFWKLRRVLRLSL